MGEGEAAVVFEFSQQWIDGGAAGAGDVSVDGVSDAGGCSEDADQVVAVGCESAGSVGVGGGRCVVRDDRVLKLSVRGTADAAAGGCR